MLYSYSYRSIARAYYNTLSDTFGTWVDDTHVQIRVNPAH